ncbi:MAG: hypothetical protein ACWIPJ_08965 [Polaribacter sp.]
MKKKHLNKFSLIVPIISLIVIAFQMVIVRTDGLSRWKGGGFGMYSEIHFSQHEVWVNNTDFSLDSLTKNNSEVRLAVNKLKLIPSQKNLRQAAKLIQKLSRIDTIIIQVWKPYINIEKSLYTRKLINELKYIN